MQLNTCPEVAAVLLDLNFPGGHGLDLLPLIRKWNPNVPVIITSAQSDPDTVQTGFERGAVDFISKPFDLDMLLCRLNGHLGQLRP